jgi:excisionase family DNA binding protein
LRFFEWWYGFDAYVYSMKATRGAESRRSVYDLLQRDDLLGWKVGRTWLLTKAAVLRWLEASLFRSPPRALSRQGAGERGVLRGCRTLR